MIKLSKGLNIPINGEPVQTILGSQGDNNSMRVSHVALLGCDYHGMKPSMKVKVGDTVKAGSLVFEDKKNPGVIFTAQAAGEVVAINRGPKRVFESLVIKLQGQEKVDFGKHSLASIAKMNPEGIKDFLVKTGLWPVLKTRPFSKTPLINSAPHSIFVTMMDTDPLAPHVSVVLANQKEEFKAGLSALAALSPKLFVCLSPEDKPFAEQTGLKNLQIETFSGPHPAGLAGTHIHHLDPVSLTKTVWSVYYQDVIAIGRTLLTGHLDSSKVISVGGSMVKKPGLYKVLSGASTIELTQGLIKPGINRIVSGSLLCGRQSSYAPTAYLGRFHRQICVIEEPGAREFLGWAVPGFKKYSALNVVASKLLGAQKFNFSTTLSGSHRSMVPIGAYEKVFPLDMEPTFLLRSLFSRDTERAKDLGVLELDEEDMSLCTFVSTTKEDYGILLRENLNIIEKDG